jgi:PAS domain S-box-containing protein
MPTARRGRSSADSELLDHVADIVVEFETDGRIVAVNRAVERTFGRTPESLIGCSFLELLAPEDRNATLAEFRKVVETGSELTIRCHVPRADCTRVAIDASLRRFERAPGETSVAAVCREVTQPASEAALEKLRSARFRAIFESGPAPTALADPGGMILSANRAFKRFFSGIGHMEELIAAIHVAQRAALATAWYESTREGGTERGAVDVSLVDASGDRVWIALAWSAIASEEGERLFAIQGTDIRPRKQVELALSQLLQADDASEFEGLRALVASLARALELDRLILARSAKTGEERWESLVVWQSGELLETGPLELAGLPEATVARGEVCIHPAGVTQLLPAVADRVGRSLQSFAGQPLFDGAGRIVGWIAGYAERPLQSPEAVRDLLAVAARPAGTLDHRAQRTRHRGSRRREHRCERRRKPRPRIRRSPVRSPRRARRTDLERGRPRPALPRDPAERRSRLRLRSRHDRALRQRDRDPSAAGRIRSDPRRPPAARAARRDRCSEAPQRGPAASHAGLPVVRRAHARRGPTTGRRS